MSQIEVGESSNPSSYFPVGTQVQIIPAPTLGSVMGMNFDQLPIGWTPGDQFISDLIYLWNPIMMGWYPYFSWMHLMKQVDMQGDGTTDKAFNQDFKIT